MITDSQSRAVINALEARVAHLEAENEQLKQENSRLRDSLDLTEMRTCPSCHNRYPNYYTNWPGYLIPGEPRCAACYAFGNGNGAT